MGYMPLMVNLKTVAVFGGERGEGLQKTQKLSVFADQVVVVPEADPGVPELVFPAGRLSEVKERLELTESRRVRVLPKRADLWSDQELQDLVAGCSFVVSDLTSRPENERISRICAQVGRPCTVVDTKDLSTVWFMSLAAAGSFTAAVSSGGRIAFFAARVREKIQKLLDDQAPQAPLWESLRDALPRENRLSGLNFLWKNTWFRLVMKIWGPKKAYTSGCKILKKKGFLSQNPDQKETV